MSLSYRYSILDRNTQRFGFIYLECRKTLKCCKIWLTKKALISCQGFPFVCLSQRIIQGMSPVISFMKEKREDWKELILFCCRKFVMSK